MFEVSFLGDAAREQASGAAELSTQEERCGQHLSTNTIECCVLDPQSQSDGFSITAYSMFVFVFILLS